VSTLDQIEEAIAKLPVAEFHELLRRLRERDDEAWDRELEEDVKSGRLDRLYARLEKENTGEEEIPLNDFLDQSQFPKTL